MRKQLIALALTLTFAAVAHADTWNKRYAVTGVPNLYFKTRDGQLRVTSTDASAIAVHVSTEGYRLAPDDVTIEESQNGASVRVEIHVPHYLGVFSLSHRRIEVEIEVPRHTNLDLNTADGSIEAARVAGELRFHTGDGHLTLHDLDGSLVAFSGDGHIDVDGRFDGLELRSGDGRIEAEARPGSRIASSWSLRSGDGSIRLLLPDAFAADLDATTGGGAVNVDFPITLEGKIRRSRIQGKMNGGGGLLHVRTGDGSIRIMHR